MISRSFLARVSHCTRPTLQKLSFANSVSAAISRRRGLATPGSVSIHDSTVQDGIEIRNIGIIAHIDAGKTTTTERMLYYSGFIRRLGNVDEGSTVTDFLPAERARGITIQSAAVTFFWPPGPSSVDNKSNATESFKWQTTLSPTHPCQINLIDTPGHADFTFEVRRSLRVLDGAVCILDGVAGVEAQTEEVWKQAASWRIPRIVYVNKLDRDGAAFGRAVVEIGTRLSGWPAVCQIPWWENGKGNFTGIGDVIGLQGFLYAPGGDGRNVTQLALTELRAEYPDFAQELITARTALVELLSEHDDEMVEAFLDVNEDHLAVQPEKIIQSLRKLIADGQNTIIPVLAGSSFRNIGVQPLLDMVVALLPSPIDRPDPEVSMENHASTLQMVVKGVLPLIPRSTKKKETAVIAANFITGCALTFKVVSDPRKGVLVYVRVYYGTINRGDTLYNTNVKASEKATTLLQMFASESVPVNSIGVGQIGVLAGSKMARTGDTLITYQGNKQSPPEPLSDLQLRPIEVPPPVFFAAVEARSLREERDVQEKLALLLREDPSLHVHKDEDTGQTLLSGMGELHLEIASDRLVTFHKANASIGSITIGYRETPNGSSAPMRKLFEKDRSDTKGKAGCTATISPWSEDDATPSDIDYAHYITTQDGNQIIIQAPTIDEDGHSLTPEGPNLPPTLKWTDITTAYLNGALAALSRGPKRSYPVRGARLVLQLSPLEDLFGTDSTTTALTAAARFATIAAFKDVASKSGLTLMEPIMTADIAVDEASLGGVAQDISSTRGGHILSLGDDGDEASASVEGSISNERERPAIDARKIYAPKDPYELDSSLRRNDSASSVSRPNRVIKAKVPLKEMVGYLKHLRSLSGGRGTFVMKFDDFVKMPAQREKQVLAELDGLSR